MIIERKFFESGMQKNEIIFMYFCYRPCNMIWRRALGPPSNLGPSSNSGLQGPPFQPLNIIYETILMVRWMKATFELDQP